MAVVANIAVNLDATKALAGLKGLDGAVKGLGGGVTRLGQQMSGLAGIAAGIGTGAAVSGFVKAGVEADRTAKTIKALAGQYKETEGVTRLAADAAKQYGLGQTTAAKSVADLYGRLRPMGVSLENIRKTFNGVNKAAGLMNLTTADTEGVMLQLSQAMGSGALQGDELRSIMERLPAVGQAVAKVMGVTVGEVKQLGADGKITTDILIKAMEELNKIQPPPPDAFKLFRAAMEDLNTSIGQQLLPVMAPLIQRITELVAKFKELGVGTTIAQALIPLADVLLRLIQGFMQLDPGMQKAIVQFGVIAGVISLIIVPLGLVVQAFGTLITAVGTVVGVLGSLSIFATIAGWLGALGPLLGTAGTAVAAFFTGPVGWITLAVAAGVAIYAFRDQIADAFSSVGQYFADMAAGWQIFTAEVGKVGEAITSSLGTAFEAAVSFVKDNFVKPVADIISSLISGISKAFESVKKAITTPFEAAANIVRAILNGLLGIVENTVNAIVGAINRMISRVNNISSKLGIAAIPLLENVKLPRFAEGGYVTQATTAIIGEGGEPEYVIPASKMQAAMERYGQGARGKNVIPNQSNSLPSNGNSSFVPQVNITTGPVMQMDGTNYVTQRDLVSATGTAARQGAKMALEMLQNNPASRRSTGVTR